MTSSVRIEAVKNHLVFEGVEYHETDGLGKICRILRERDPLCCTAHVYRGETLCLTVDVQKRAGMVLEERDKHGLIFTKERKPK